MRTKQKKELPFPEIADTSGLKDADWAAINALRRAHETGGKEGLSKAVNDLLGGDPVRATRVLGAFYPREVTELLKDAMAERGITKEDVLEWMRQAESPAREQ